MEGGEQPSTVARQQSKIMRLESADFHTLVSIYPELNDAIGDYRKHRLAEMVDGGILSANDCNAILEK